MNYIKKILLDFLNWHDNEFVDKVFPEENEKFIDYYLDIKKLNNKNNTTVKELVRKTFGNEAAEEDSIVKLYEGCMQIAIEDMKKDFAQFLFDKEYLVRTSVDEILEEYEKYINKNK